MIECKFENGETVIDTLSGLTVEITGQRYIEESWVYWIQDGGNDTESVREECDLARPEDVGPGVPED